MMINNVGDIVVCHTACVMSSSGIKATTVSKSYTVTKFEAGYRFCIIDDCNHEHGFSLDKNYHSYYEKWFHDNIKEIRMKKLKKILKKKVT